MRGRLGLPICGPPKNASAPRTPPKALAHRTRVCKLAGGAMQIVGSRARSSDKNLRAGSSSFTGLAHGCHAGQLAHPTKSLLCCVVFGSLPGSGESATLQSRIANLDRDGFCRGPPAPPCPTLCVDCRRGSLSHKQGTEDWRSFFSPHRRARHPRRHSLRGKAFGPGSRMRTSAEPDFDHV